MPAAAARAPGRPWAIASASSDGGGTLGAIVVTYLRTCLYLYVYRHAYMHIVYSIHIYLHYMCMCILWSHSPNIAIYLYHTPQLCLKKMMVVVQVLRYGPHWVLVAYQSLLGSIIKAY